MTKPHVDAGATHELDAPDPAATEGEAGGPATPPKSPLAGAPAPPLEESVEAFRERWLRAEADLQNFRRRARRDVDEAWRSAEETAMLELMSFLDDLERALAAADVDADASGAPPSWSEGVRLVVQRMKDALARQRVEVIDPAGAPFDPTFHEAVLEVDAPENVPPGHVVTVVHKGYRRDGRALRAARVVVAREPGSGDG